MTGSNRWTSRSRFSRTALWSILTLATLTSAPALAVGWEEIAGVGYTEVVEGDDWSVEKEYPEALAAAAGQEITISGFYVPIEAQAYVTNFLLVPDPADCPFCGSSGYGISLEVHAAEPMPDLPEATELTLTGTVELVDDPYTYQALRLVEARPEPLS
ncbi:DUF3299 domain-containing protein [Histidinibacterium aquaticum]|uniref:DUF3299 domain-containing protein n=1 Tax=Histidinibacterium aquaticum TaxID=2613962 RepID=A0A5J5GAZ0_9RHOB|nr:DUF3299 domain-containing protein [Histidinibacterium aquaticum]KAA9005279.1 DUF3299 domain-containing protein [Histidinibacterium aquaticum]